MWDLGSRTLLVLSVRPGSRACCVERAAQSCARCVHVSVTQQVTRAGAGRGLPGETHIPLFPRNSPTCHFMEQARLCSWCFHCTTFRELSKDELTRRGCDSSPSVRVPACLEGRVTNVGWQAGVIPSSADLVTRGSVSVDLSSVSEQQSLSAPTYVIPQRLA